MSWQLKITHSPVNPKNALTYHKTSSLNLKPKEYYVNKEWQRTQDPIYKKCKYNEQITYLWKKTPYFISVNYFNYNHQVLTTHILYLNLSIYQLYYYLYCRIIFKIVSNVIQNIIILWRKSFTYVYNNCNWVHPFKIYK